MELKTLWAAGLLTLCAVGAAALQLRAAAPAAPAAPATTAAATAARPAPRAQHVVIISIDGCRPDVLLRADAPNIRKLMARGSFTFYAETTDVAITLPSHTSMITGVKPDRHGINFNDDPPEDLFPKVPTILNLAHDRGMKTGLFSTKSKFSLYTPPGVVDYSAISKESSSPDDIAIATAAADAIIRNKPNAMLVHFGNNDKVGHAKGWGTPEQIIAVEGADTAVGKVVDALHSSGIYSKTLIILSSDHGGSGVNHGKDDPRSRYIPWIAVGPGVRINYDLTRTRSLTVRTEDTFATACHFLGLTAPADIDGRPVYEIIETRTQEENRASTRPASRPATSPATNQAAALDMDDELTHAH